MDLNKFTEKAQSAITEAQSIATRRQHQTVDVEHVAAIQEKQLLEADYGSTLEKFRRVSKLKKELDRRPPIRSRSCSRRPARRPRARRSSTAAADRLPSPDAPAARAAARALRFPPCASPPCVAPRHFRWMT